MMFRVTVSSSTVCKTLMFMGCTRQCMHHIALQRSDTLQAQFMATISMTHQCLCAWMRVVMTAETIRKQVSEECLLPIVASLLGASDILQFP